MIARWMVVGFVLSLAVVFAFRFVEDSVFTAGVGGVSWLFMTAPFVMFALTYLLLKVLRVDPSDRSEAASIFALPGFLMGIYEINSFSAVFPNLDPSHGSQFAALVYACSAAALLAGVVSSRLRLPGQSN